MITLGIDTSNYTTSVALASDGEILLDKRILLKVKEGGLGLRQSDAIYQHYENLPILLKDALDYKIEKIVVSTRPRPKEGSYMPVFNAGKNIADILSKALDVPTVYLSHQEGHILSAMHKNDVDFNKPIVCAHLSGGTLELVNNQFEIIGATKDISYGQLIDRAGVKFGLKFPCGKEIDEMALNMNLKGNPLSKFHIEGTKINLSGIENQINESKLNKEELSFYLMERISESFVSLINNTGIKQVLVTGGVASSKFLRNYCKDMGYIFGDNNLTSDNAVGLALSEGITPWQLEQ